jgi:hypothetical protein
MNIKIGTVVHAHVFRERLDVLLAVLTPIVLMLESGYANGWVFANGDMSFSINLIWSMARGVFLEALIFACFKLVRHFFLSGGWQRVLIPVPLAIGVVGMIVSSGCNLGWINRSGEMAHMVAMIAQFLPGWMVETFKTGLGLLFPLSVGAFALFDISHLMEEAFTSARHQVRAMQVHLGEEAMKSVQKQMKQVTKELDQQYGDIIRADAQKLVDNFRQGDRTFGMLNTPSLPAQSSFTRVTPIQPTQPTMLPPFAQPGQLPQPVQPQAQPAQTGWFKNFLGNP